MSSVATQYRDEPDFCDEVVNGIPCQGPISDASPPAHEVSRRYICVCVKVICDGNLIVLEWWGDEADPE